jgi:hypothetical protein
MYPEEYPCEWHEEVTIVTDLEQLKAELRELMGSWEYAFAMGHGCTIGEHPRFWITRRRADVLKARIQELEG